MVAAAAISVLLASAPTLSPQAVASRHGVVIAAEEGWTQEELADVDAVLSALPTPFLRLPDAPLRLERTAILSAFGVDGGTEPRAELRLSRLSADERRRLWRRRAVVHALMLNWEERQRWSERAAWRRISGWIRPFERPLAFREHALNVYDGAFSRSAGRTSATLDLVTFAEEALVPVESLRPDALSADEAVRCQEFAKSRFLEGALRELGAEVTLTGGSCPAFDEWSRREALTGAEVLFVAASGRAPESLFGHLLLRLIHEDRERVSGPSFGTAVQLVALTGSDVPDIRYLVRGTTGGYSTAVMTAPIGELVHQTLEGEQRTIRRFKLNLSREELTRLAERIWELERRGYFEYWFFTDNCASTLAFLLEGVLDDGRTIRMPPRLSPVLPSAVLDALADAGLLTLEPGAYESTRDRAARSEALRATSASVLDRSHASERWGRIRRRVEDPRLAVRRTGWRQLAEFTRSDAARLSSAELRALYEYWLHTVRIERYAVEVADAERREILAQAIDRAGITFPGSDETVRERQQLFAREDPLNRRLAVLDRIAFSEVALRRAPLDKLDDGERRMLADAEALADGFAQLTDLHGDAVEAVFADMDPAQTLQADVQARQLEERRWSSRAVSHSGYARFAAGVGTSMVKGGEIAPVMVVESGALDERLGEQRLHGFRASSELRVLAGRVELRPRAGLPEISRSHLTLLGYRTIQREVPTFRSSPLDHLGWGAQATWDREASLSRPDRLSIDAEALWVPAASSTFARFTAVGVGVTGRWRWGASWIEDSALEVSPLVSFEQRLPIGDDLADALSFEAAWRPVWTVARGGFAHELAASVGGSFRLRSIFGRDVLLAPRAAVTSSDRTRFGVELLIEPLRGVSSPSRR